MTQSPPAAIASLPVNVEACFSDAKGRRRRSLEKRSVKLLRNAMPILERVLEHREEVLWVSAACSPYSALELLTTGWIIAMVRRCVLVVTDRRILHFPARGDFSPRGSISEIRFGDLESAEAKGMVGGKLILRYRDGSKETFTGISGSDCRKLKLLLELRASQGAPTEQGRRRFLCPYCSQALEQDVSRCGVCGFAFRDRRRALRWSLLVPGGGYFYTGHGILGLFDALVEGFLILAVASGVVLAISGEPAIWFEILLFGGVLAVEKLITVFHAQHYVREYLPVDRKAALTRDPLATG